jgi:hypothetical protein
MQRSGYCNKKSLGHVISAREHSGHSHERHLLNRVARTCHEQKQSFEFVYWAQCPKSDASEQLQPWVIKHYDNKICMSSPSVAFVRGKEQAGCSKCRTSESLQRILTCS